MRMRMRSVPQHRAKLIGFQSTVVNSAYAIGPAVGGYLCDLYGARMAFFLVCAHMRTLPPSLHRTARRGAARRMCDESHRRFRKTQNGC